MASIERPSGGGAFRVEGLPAPPYEVAILGAGRVGGALARALTAAGHHVVAALRRADDPRAIAGASVVVIAVPDDALAGAAAVVAGLARPGTVVVHTSGLSGVAPLASCGRNVAAVHPAIPIPSPHASLAGAVFGVTCPEHMRAWCEDFVADLGATPLFVAEEDRPRYHAALAIASNFAVVLAGDAADLLGGHEVLVPLLRRTIENVARLGPDAALTGPVVRGDAGTVREHLRTLPPEMLEAYVANARRALARAVGAGRLDGVRARAIENALEEALVR